MPNFYKKFTTLAILLSFFAFPLLTLAEMRSSSYIIYENLLHAFNGPVITSVSSSVVDNVATITWNTNIPSNSYVIYDEDNSFATSREQGNGSISVTNHSVNLVGLDYSTTYYFRVKSKSPNGMDSIGSVYTFSVGGDPTPPPAPPSGGGGILIIDKTDKFAPEITNIQISDITLNGAKITWTTNENATSFVEYGIDLSYGNVFGEWTSTNEHQVILKNLKAGTIYNFRALSSDNWGNVAYSPNFSFETIREDAPVDVDEDTEEEDELMIDTDDDGIPDTVIPPEDLDSLLRKAVEIMENMAGSVSVETLKDRLEVPFDYLNRLANFIPAPIFNADPRVDVESGKATIYWRTNVEASGLVAYTADSQYNPDSLNPYTTIIGDPNSFKSEHAIELFGLEPNTVYHYQLRSKGQIGPMAVTGDYTFRTSIETIQISNFYSQVIDDNSAVFKWVTNKESDSKITYTPYRGDLLAVEESKEIKDSVRTVIHEVTISDFQPGVRYNIRIESEDINGNIATEIIDPFSTSEDDYPPIISQIKTNSSISSDRDGKIQTVVSWITNEPSTTMVYYMEGVHGPNVELSGKTEKKNDYSRDHVVLFTEFSPGTVYTFRVESIDSGGNKTLSDPNTFMTPRKSESIIDVIIRVLEDTFGWVKDIMK